ncbi:MAG: hypothetical protein U5J62_02055 [Desulfurivibrio sp.]|nr:hypothetical protein [Desulfurivibrio sp.]
MTALCFILGGLSLGLLLLGGVRRHRTLWWGALVSAAMLGLLAFTLLLAYLQGVPILQGSGLDTPALSTSLAFFLLALTLQILAARRIWTQEMRPGREELRGVLALILILVVLIGGVIAAFFVSFYKHERSYLAATDRHLLAVVELKVERISSWLREYRINGEELANDHGFAQRVEMWLQHDSVPDRELVGQRLVDLKNRYNLCGIILLDRQGRTRYQHGTDLSSNFALAELQEEARREGTPVASDLFRDPEGGGLSGLGGAHPLRPRG